MAGAPSAVGETARRRIRINDNKRNSGKAGLTLAVPLIVGMDGYRRASTRNFTAIGAVQAQISSLFERVINVRPPVMEPFTSWPVLSAATRVVPAHR
ncbi:hypothetical protein PBR20603_01898 [Pandoraea bronchicola]|uniref:Uncharacterized protein n=1 Tax=Pandoraea bronchicola TaxID=2508287 RepID=A0A5E5BRK4_9BURK|nr:hypothetical protein PBR20603_01898 [Pandoraea bronchicola]